MDPFEKALFQIIANIVAIFPDWAPPARTTVLINRTETGLFQAMTDEKTTFGKNIPEAIADLELPEKKIVIMEVVNPDGEQELLWWDADNDCPMAHNRKEVRVLIMYN